MSEAPKILVAMDASPSSLWADLGLQGAVTFTADGNEAYAMLTHGEFTVLFLDLELPGLDGMTLLPRVCGEKLCPTVFLTSREPSFPYAQQGFLWGAKGYLLRPLREKDVAAALDQARPDEAVSDLSLHTAAENLADRFRIDTISALLDLADSSDGGHHDAAWWRALYVELVSSVFLRFSWLKLYHHAGGFALPELAEDLAPAQLRTYLCRRLEALQGAILDLFPLTNDPQMDEMLTYLLREVEQTPPQKDVARRFYLANSTLSTRFQKQLGICYREYLTRLKITRAQYLLQHTDTAEGEVAARLGYRDRDHFAQLYYQRTGQTIHQTRQRSWSGYCI